MTHSGCEKNFEASLIVSNRVVAEAAAQQVETQWTSNAQPVNWQAVTQHWIASGKRVDYYEARSCSVGPRSTSWGG